MNNGNEPCLDLKTRSLNPFYLMKSVLQTLATLSSETALHLGHPTLHFRGIPKGRKTQQSKKSRRQEFTSFHKGLSVVLAVRKSL